LTDIERTYGKRKPISARTPIAEEAQAENRVNIRSNVGDAHESDASMTAVTDSDFSEAYDSDAGTMLPERRPSPIRRRPTPPRKLTQHDMLNKYFRKDPVGVFNLDLLRYVSSHVLLLKFVA